MTTTKKLGKITFVYDERLSRQKTLALTRVINAIRQIADVQLVQGNIGELELLEEIEQAAPHLILAPWHRYHSWSKIEGFYGLARNSGPTFAGYHFGQLLPIELGAQPEFMRAILLDFAHCSLAEILLLIRTLILDTTRSGIKPLIGPNAPIYYENWHDRQGLGNRTDTVLSLPEIAKGDWRHRAGVIRIVLGAFWSLIYEEGPGKSEFQQSLTGSTPKACFQAGVADFCLVFRLIYNMPGWSPKDVVSGFWPNADVPTGPAQLLLKYTDFLRVHRFTETADIEVVAGFFKTGVASKYPDEVHTLWVEPLKASLLTEEPFAAAGLEHPGLKPLPIRTPPAEAKLTVIQTQEGDIAASLKTKEKQLQDSLNQIRELKKALKEKEELVQELRSGGLGTSQPLPPPDAEGLLEAFQERYFDAKFQLRDFEHKISSLEKNGGTAEELAALQQKMQELASRQECWIRTLAETLRSFQEDRKRVGKTS